MIQATTLASFHRAATRAAPLAARRARARMTRVLLYTAPHRLAHARSGDKGDTVNVGVIARRPEFWDVIRREVSVPRVKAHFGDMVGAVERFELPNLHALNFLMHEALGGGGTVSLMTDAQGKTFSTAVLRMEIDVPDEVAALLEPAP